MYELIDTWFHSYFSRLHKYHLHLVYTINTCFLSLVCILYYFYLIIYISAPFISMRVERVGKLSQSWKFSSFWRLNSQRCRCFWRCGSFAVLVGLHGHGILNCIVCLSWWIWSEVWRLLCRREEWMLRWLMVRLMWWYLNRRWCCWRCGEIVFKMIRQMSFVVGHVVQWLMMFCGIRKWRWMSWGDKIVVRLSIEWMKVVGIGWGCGCMIVVKWRRSARMVVREFSHWDHFGEMEFKTWRIVLLERVGVCRWQCILADNRWHALIFLIHCWIFDWRFDWLMMMMRRWWLMMNCWMVIRLRGWWSCWTMWICVNGWSWRRQHWMMMHWSWRCKLMGVWKRWDHHISTKIRCEIKNILLIWNETHEKQKKTSTIKFQSFSIFCFATTGAHSAWWNSSYLRLSRLIAADNNLHSFATSCTIWRLTELPCFYHVSSRVTHGELRRDIWIWLKESRERDNQLTVLAAYIEYDDDEVLECRCNAIAVWGSAVWAVHLQLSVE